MEDEKVKYFKELCPDVVVVAAYGKILPSKLLNIGDSKFISTLLCCHDGGGGTYSKIYYGNGSTNRYFDYEDVPKLDAGPYLIQEKIKIAKNDNQFFKQQIVNFGSKL